MKIGHIGGVSGFALIGRTTEISEFVWGVGSHRVITRFFKFLIVFPLTEPRLVDRALPVNSYPFGSFQLVYKI